MHAEQVCWLFRAVHREVMRHAPLSMQSETQAAADALEAATT